MMNALSLSPLNLNKELHAKIAACRLVQEHILFVMLNGCLLPTLSELNKLPAEAVITDAQQGWTLTLSDQCEFEFPLHLLCLYDAEQSSVNTTKQIILGKNAKLCLLEEHFALTSAALFSARLTTKILLENNAYLEYYKQQSHQSAKYSSEIFIEQQQDSNLHHIDFSLDNSFVENKMQIKLLAAGASCRSNGLYHTLFDQQFIQHQLQIDHVAPRTQSAMLYKGILDQQSQAKFYGRVHVAKDAQKIRAEQANHHLLLSPKAQAFSKPELEIYADDVQCKHGATTGEIDQDALFYLRSRGISEADALQIMLRGFAEEIVQSIKNRAIRLHLQHVLGVC